jgi:uncharacterized cupredoxin-like copper-binding protein
MRTTLLLAAALASGGAAWGHGEAPHAASTARPEQKDWGIAGDRRDVRRTIAVGMSDAMRFTPARIDVSEGETVRFIVRNTGKVRHEFVIGTRAELDAHAALMAKFPDMEHDEPFMAHVAPGGRGEIVWTFNRVGEFDFACLIAGHYGAGMKGTIRVNPRTQGASNATKRK